MTVHAKDQTLFSVRPLDQPKALPSGDETAAGGRYTLDPGVLIPGDTLVDYLCMPREKLKEEIPSDQKIWLPGLAKRRQFAIKSAHHFREAGSREWGIRIVEGPNYMLFICGSVVFGIACLLIGCTVAWRLGDAFKGLGGAGAAFGIGSWTLKLVYDLMKDMDDKPKAS